MNIAVPASILLAGALIAAAVAYGSSERVIELGNMYVVHDRWTDTQKVCVGQLTDMRTPNGQQLPAYSCYEAE